MRITIFGAAGAVGSRTVTEALARGHDVTAAVRDLNRARSLPAGVVARVGDASDAAAVGALAAGQDLVISATRPPDGDEESLVTTAKALLSGLAGTGVRLLLVGGAATLRVPGTHRMLLDDPRYLPAPYLPIALACAAQLETCRDSSGVDWTYLSPPAMLLPGARTGRYRVGVDQLLVDERGDSQISMEDFAVALLDEAERPRHRGRRFTVGY